jgi:hypothetical protein
MCLHHHSKMGQKEISKVAGVDAVMQWFGGWPSFHDAEVISIFLARKNLFSESIPIIRKTQPRWTSFLEM